MKLRLRLWMLMVGVALVALAISASFWHASWRRHHAILAQLARPDDLSFFKNETPLADLAGYVKVATTTPRLPDGVPVRIDWETIDPGDKGRASFTFSTRFFSTEELRALRGQSLFRSLELLLAPQGLTPVIQDDVLIITRPNRKDHST